MIDGWVDAIADAVEDDEAAGPAFDPFGHKLVRRTMTDYLERIAVAKADIARLKGEKEAFEQSNAPDDLDEEELAGWNYAKEIERQIRELKTEHRDELRKLSKLENAAMKRSAPAADRGAHRKAALELASVTGQLEALEGALAPYGRIKEQLAEARARYRGLTDEFVTELKSRCGALDEKQMRVLVLELLAQDVQAGLAAAVAEKQQELVRFIERLWDKYRVTLTDLRGARSSIEGRLQDALTKLRYT